MAHVRQKIRAGLHGLFCCRFCFLQCLVFTHQCADVRDAHQYGSVTAIHQVLHRGVVAGEAPQLPLPKAVGSAVAEVGDEEPASP